ncbi:hypothetical protein Bpfe_016638 [Biomphalaria pfeifferi]|uniref:Uncharacterized protein n=1 Tax=Biomphalaria pfeifferi TaxID=112525 RepID=A0AAD8BFX8_BIOPF|nr:hypothetical protein Bpfe_016638 [Biomphalaria pfeifferi]
MDVFGTAPQWAVSVIRRPVPLLLRTKLPTPLAIQACTVDCQRSCDSLEMETQHVRSVRTELDSSHFDRTIKAFN